MNAPTRAIGDPDLSAVLAELFNQEEHGHTAEEVRDFVQLAARSVHEGKTREELADNSMMSSFIEWSASEAPAND